MPNKRPKTTLVTEDELVEAVTTRVKDSMKEDLDLRFGRFERALERIAGPERPEQPTQTQPPQSGQQDINQHASNIDTSEQGHFPPRADAQSTLTGFVNLPEAPRQTPLDQAQGARPRMRQPQAAAASAVNNNKDTWDQWFTSSRPIDAYQGASTSAPFNTKAAYDAVIDAQVRHIMENTQHQLKGTVTSKKFPYEYVTRGPEKKKLSFNTVTLAEHLLGIFCMLDDPDTNPAIRPNLVAHMREIVEDAAEFEWSTNVRRWSEEVFSLIADRRLPDGWNSTARIQNIRTGMSRVEAARLTTHKEGVARRFQPNNMQGDNLRGGPPCQDFNSANGCHLQSGHMLHGKRQVHVCSYCLANTAAVHPHSEHFCRTKQKHNNYHF